MNVKIASKHKIEVGSTMDIVPIMWEILLRENKRGQNKEHFWAVGLSNSNKILYIELVSLGSVKSTVVTPSEVLELASIKLAVKLIMVHNHPSGNLTPSDADKDITEEMIQAARLLHKEVLDHIIISTDDFYSFAESGLFAELEKSERFVPPYLLKNKAREEGLIKGKKEGEKNNSIKIAKKMLSSGMEVDNVADFTGLTKTKVKDLLKVIKSEADKG